jgi:CxxC-x17-CxxC domain-containing protein
MPSAPGPYNHDHENEVIPFLETNFRGERRKFGIKTDDRRRHVYVIGKTGMGKTTMLENMILADIFAGHGVAYVDPHGDTADKILDFIPPWRVNDVVYFNPADMAWPVGFNILEIVNENQKHLVASGLMGVFKKIWPDVWSPRMEYILLNCVLALLDTPGSTLLGIARILSDKEFRKIIVANIKDPVVKGFWLNEFAKYTEKFATEAIAPVQNKVGQFLSAAIIRNIVAQQTSTIDLREIMDSRKIFVVNLSKGLIGEDSSKLLGGMLITRLQLAAMERVDMPEKDRQDYYLYVDEFQNFATESFANILSEARKYRLNLITAHQYIEQLDETVAAAVFGNVGTIVSFRVGAGDAEALAKEFAPVFVEEDIINLAKFEVYLKLMIDGVASAPFSARTLPPIALNQRSRDKVIKVSRERYAMPRAEIEEKINKWSGFDERMAAAVPGATPEAAPFVGSDRQYKADCSRCGKELHLKSAPDPSRPFYCKKCLPLARAEAAGGQSRISDLARTAVPESRRDIRDLPAPPPRSAARPAPARPAPPPPAAPRPPAPTPRSPRIEAAKPERPLPPPPKPGMFAGKIRVVKETEPEALKETEAAETEKKETPPPPPPKAPEPKAKPAPMPAPMPSARPAPIPPPPPPGPQKPSQKPPEVPGPSSPKPLGAGESIFFE